jgi:Zn-finger nucleic acid-binding protein
MQALTRANVEFDMCPSCRGVWLDRGELEKIIQGAREGEPTAGPAAAAFTQRPPPRERYDERGEHGERGEYGERGEHSREGGHRRKRGFDLFDIFD